MLAITRDGRVAVMNDIAYRILGLTPRPRDIGRPFTRSSTTSRRHRGSSPARSTCRTCPTAPRCGCKSTGQGRSATRCRRSRTSAGSIIGATLFFKDLTRVEQLEERERLRDRLAALGEMAAAIAHEVKNPLAGIEVMAGVLKRQLPESPDAQSILDDIIKEAKMANAIVLEVLEFVRPIRLQVEQIVLADVISDAITLAESHVPRGDVAHRHLARGRTCRASRATRTSCARSSRTC